MGGFGNLDKLSLNGGTSGGPVSLHNAIGASIEDKETVREASYGYRQRRRHEEEDNDADDGSEDAPAER